MYYYVYILNSVYDMFWIINGVSVSASKAGKKEEISQPVDWTHDLRFCVALEHVLETLNALFLLNIYFIYAHFRRFHESWMPYYFFREFVFINL